MNREISGFNTDLINVDSGIWTATSTYTTLSGSSPYANFGVFWAGNWLAANGAPNAQPQADSFRVYLPTDGGGAPSKPVVYPEAQLRFRPQSSGFRQHHAGARGDRRVQPCCPGHHFFGQQPGDGQYPGQRRRLRRQSGHVAGSDRLPAVDRRHGQHHLEPGHGRRRRHGNLLLSSGCDSDLGRSAPAGDRHARSERYHRQLCRRNRPCGHGHLHLRTAVRPGRDRSRQPDPHLGGRVLLRRLRRGEPAHRRMAHGRRGRKRRFQPVAPGPGDQGVRTGQSQPAAGTAQLAAGRRLPLRRPRGVLRRARCLQAGGDRRPGADHELRSVHRHLRRCFAAGALSTRA